MTLPRTGILPNPELEDDGCFDCGFVEATYMVHDTVWMEAWPSYWEDRTERREHEAAKFGELGELGEPGTYDRICDLQLRLETHGRLFLCLPCLADRLKRPLRLDDFTPWREALCNRPFFIILAP